MRLRTVYTSTGEMSDTPAAVDRDNHILYLNPKKWFRLTRFQRKFIMQHELGHYYLQTDSELKADEYAFNQLAGSEFRSLKQCIECLEEILDENILGHKVRIDQMYKLAIEWDKNHAHLNKGSGKSEEANEEDAMVNLVMVSNTSLIKQTQSIFNSLQNMMNTLVISVILLIAMYFTLKDAD